MQLARNAGYTRVFLLTGVEFAPYASFRVVVGATVKIQISKNGGAFANPHAGASNCTEISDGFYFFTLDPLDCDTLGTLTYKLTWPPAGGFTVGEFDQVVTALPGDPGELTNAERDAVAAAVLGLSNGVDVGVSLAHFCMAAAAVLAGKSSLAGDTVWFRNWADAKNRVVVKSNVSGRYDVTFDFS